MSQIHHRLFVSYFLFSSKHSSPLLSRFTWVSECNGTLTIYTGYKSLNVEISQIMTGFYSVFKSFL